MREKGMTQVKLAAEVNVSQAHIQKILKYPNLWGSEELRLKIVTVLCPGLTYEELLEIGRQILNKDGSAYHAQLPENIEKFVKATENIMEFSRQLKELENRLQYILKEATLEDSLELKKYVDLLYLKMQERAKEGKLLEIV
ncbi:MAG: hypothetical protein LBJ14_01760 [Desulfarculales bacterium]|nr:hypothetical protein [Desulfarculales bacterium]